MAKKKYNRSKTEDEWLRAQARRELLLTIIITVAGLLIVAWLVKLAGDAIGL